MDYNFCFFSIFLSQKKKILKALHGSFIHLDFMGFPFRTSKFKNDINYMKYKFSHKFENVYMWMDMYYSKIRIVTF
jgi:hypothetical protein